MGKQTMGTPATAIRHRTDNKLYRLQTGQTPVVRPELHNTYGMDSFPNGTNAVVAVISYTGYDMEDAMILNKSGHERGFGYGTIYKSQTIDLKTMREASKSSTTPTKCASGPPRQGPSPSPSSFPHLPSYGDCDLCPYLPLVLYPPPPPLFILVFFF